jgi:hypothetical protein
MGDWDASARSAAIDASKEAGLARPAVIEEAEQAHRGLVAEVERRKASAAAYERHVEHLVHWSAASAAAADAAELEEAALQRRYRATTAVPVLTELMHGLLVRRPDAPLGFLRRYCQLLRDAQHASASGEVVAPEAQTQPPVAQPEPEPEPEPELEPELEPEPAPQAAAPRRPAADSIEDSLLYQPGLVLGMPPRRTLGRRSYFDELQHAQRLDSTCVPSITLPAFDHAACLTCRRHCRRRRRNDQILVGGCPPGINTSLTVGWHLLCGAGGPTGGSSERRAASCASCCPLWMIYRHMASAPRGDR